MPSIWEYLANFEQRFGTEDMRIRARALRIDHLSHLKGPLPEVAARGLEVARRFQKGKATNEERDQAREACWNCFAGKYNFSSNTPEEFIARAVAMALDDINQANREEGEHMEWFFYFVEKFEGYERKKFEGETPEEEALLKKYFFVTES